MTRTGADRPRPLDVRTALAALAVAAAVAAPVVALNEIIPPPATMVTAEPNDPAVPDPADGSGGYSPYYYDTFDYTSLGGGGGGGGG
jgi:hypothetical protein